MYICLPAGQPACFVEGLPGANSAPPAAACLHLQAIGNGELFEQHRQLIDVRKQLADHDHVRGTWLLSARKLLQTAQC